MPEREHVFFGDSGFSERADDPSRFSGLFLLHWISCAIDAALFVCPQANHLGPFYPAKRRLGGPTSRTDFRSTVQNRMTGDRRHLAGTEDMLKRLAVPAGAVVRNLDSKMLPNSCRYSTHRTATFHAAPQSRTKSSVAGISRPVLAERTTRRMATLRHGPGGRATAYTPRCGRQKEMTDRTADQERIG